MKPLWEEVFKNVFLLTDHFKKKNLKISIVILNYNVKVFLDLCLSSVVRAIKNIDSEIIVVDNNSVDDSVGMVKTKYPEVQLIVNDYNAGFPKGNNIGVDKASGDYLFILNPDTVLPECFFDRLLRYYKDLQNVGIVGCKLIDGSGNFLMESKRGVPTPVVALSKVLGLYKLSPKWFGNYYNMRLDKNKNGATDILVGACMFMKKSLYYELNGFDEGCFMYADDIDLSYRALKSGYQNYYCSDVEMIHFKGESTPKDLNYQFRFREAMQFFYKKHFNYNWFLSIWLGFSTSFFSVLKWFYSSNSEQMSAHQPLNYILVSQDEVLFKKLCQHMVVPVTQATSLLHVLQHDYQSSTEIIFDLKCLNLSEVIQFMEVHKNRYTYKFLMEDRAALIGSQNSVSRGEVWILNNNSKPVEYNTV